jgi:hypothetical protein
MTFDPSSIAATPLEKGSRSLLSPHMKAAGFEKYFFLYRFNKYSNITRDTQQWDFAHHVQEYEFNWFYSLHRDPNVLLS